MTQTHPWDPTEHLDGDTAIAAYLAAAFADGDQMLAQAALADVARARKGIEIAERAGSRRLA